MESKDEIVKDWLPRYTGMNLDSFGKHVLLTNFKGYMNHFCKITGANIIDRSKGMTAATHDGITMINF